MRGRLHQRGIGSAVVALVAVTVFLAGCAANQAAPSAASPSPSPRASRPPSSARVRQRARPPQVPDPRRPAGPSSTVPTAAGTTLIAAGDIGTCHSTNDEATGALVASLPGVVATLGDTAYENGTTKELEECFGGSWGPVKDRIRFAVTGNHDIHTDGGKPLRDYMGSAAARDGRVWFSDQLGTWHVVVLDGTAAFSVGVRHRFRSDALAPRRPGCEHGQLHACADTPAAVQQRRRARRRPSGRCLGEALYAGEQYVESPRVYFVQFAYCLCNTRRCPGDLAGEEACSSSGRKRSQASPRGTRHSVSGTRCRQPSIASGERADR